MIDAIAIDVKNRIFDYAKNFWANRNNPPEPMLTMEDLAAGRPGACETDLLKGLALGYKLAAKALDDVDAEWFVRTAQEEQ